MGCCLPTGSRRNRGIGPIRQARISCIEGTKGPPTKPGTWRRRRRGRKLPTRTVTKVPFDTSGSGRSALHWAARPARVQRQRRRTRHFAGTSGQVSAVDDYSFDVSMSDAGISSTSLVFIGQFVPESVEFNVPPGAARI